MRFNHTEESLHFIGPPNPFFRLCTILLRNTIQVHLRPNHTLSGSEEALQDDHILGVKTDCVPESFLDRILSILEHKLIQLSLIWKHVKLHILKVTIGKSQTFVDFCQVILSSTKNV